MDWIDNFMGIFGLKRGGAISDPDEINKYLIEAAIKDSENSAFNSRQPKSERLVCGEKTMCYHTKDFTPGCRVKAYIDGDEGEILTAYYVIVENEHGKHMKLSLCVVWDSDGSSEMYSHATLASACVIIGLPEDYKAHLDDLKERRERLAAQHGITFKNLRDE